MSTGSTVTQVEQRIYKLEDRSFEIIQSEEAKNYLKHETVRTP